MEPITFADIAVFVNIDGKNLAQHLFVIGYPQNAYNTNSDNMWFPMPSTKTINVEIVRPVYGICKFRITATGYR